MIKFIKRNILGIGIGILFSTVGVYAASTYLASDITYKPSNSDWDVSTVQGALDDLYNNSKNCVSGTIEHKAKTNWSIDIGFVPKTFHISFTLGNSKYRNFTYNGNLNNKVYLAADDPNNLYIEDQTSIFDINSTITATLPTNWAAYTAEYTLYYTACK